MDNTEPRISSDQRDELAREVSFLKKRIDGLKQDVIDLSDSKTLLESEVLGKRVLLKEIEDNEIENLRKLMKVIKNVINE